MYLESEGESDHEECDEVCIGPIGGDDNTDEEEGEEEDDGGDDVKDPEKLEEEYEVEVIDDERIINAIRLLNSIKQDSPDK